MTFATIPQKPSGPGTRVFSVFCVLWLLALALPAFSQTTTLELKPGWNLSALPGPLAEQTAQDHGLSIYRTVNGEHQNVSPTEMAAGYGYWIYSENAASITLEGSAIEQAETVSLSLTRGWNAVGNPYGSELAWGDNVVVTTAGGAAALSDSGAVELVIYGYNTETGMYEQINGNPAMAPFAAYMVRAFEDCTIEVAFADPSGIAPVVMELSALPFDEGDTATDAGTGLAIVGTQRIVRLAPGTSTSRAENAIRAKGGRIVGRNTAMGLLQVEFDEGDDPVSLLADVAGVADSAPNLIFQQTDLPNDPVFTDADPDNDSHLQAVLAPEGWTIAGTGPPGDPVIAILDSGVNADHEELSGRVLPGYNFVDDNEETSDNSGHGTSVAGLAAAAGNNAIGTAGLCWNCRILPVKVLSDTGHTSVYTVITGIIYAADNGADVINISLSGPTDHGFWEQEFTRAVNYARAQGALVVGSAGNDNADASEFLPAAVASVFTVAAVNADNQRAPFSNFGASVDAAAPGVQLYTTGAQGYTWFSGTSAAAPMASGLAGLLKAQNPDWTPGMLEQALAGGALALSTDQPLGAGLIQAPAALEYDPTDPGGGQTGGGTTPGTGGGSDPGMSGAAECVVTSNASSGVGTLADCINYANNHTGADTIRFDLPPTNRTITLDAALPPITGNDTTIDGEDKNIILNGNYLGFDGLVVNSSDNFIKGLNITRFYILNGNAAGIRITGSGAFNNYIKGCHIGTDYQNKTAFQNNHGIVIEGGAYKNYIGDGSTAGRNTISGNSKNGILISSSWENEIKGNYIGTKNTGMVGLPNGFSPQVGTYAGINITGSASTQNLIGGYSTSGHTNIISGNDQYGIYIANGDYNEIHGNIIGLNEDATGVIANKYTGITLEGDASYQTVGGTAESLRNIIAGNGWSGVVMAGPNTNNNQFFNNWIGVGGPDGDTKYQNNGEGIRIQGGTNNKIGGTSAGQGNVISGNVGWGVLLSGATTTNNTVQGNKIGPGASGSDSVGNGQGGVLIMNGATENAIGSRFVAEAGENTIAYNVLWDGIRVLHDTTIKNTFFKNSIYDNGGLGIDLGGNGHTENDVTAPGPNNYLDYPELTDVASAGVDCYNLAGTKAINTYAHVYRVGGAGPDPSGYGEGQEYLARSDPTTVGDPTFTLSNVCPGGAFKLTFLATDPDGNTSEFSRNFDLSDKPVVSDIQFDPNPVIANGFKTTHATCKVTYGNGLDLVKRVYIGIGSIGGVPEFPMYDDGLHNDGTDGDGIYGSDEFTVEEGTSGPVSLPVYAEDIADKVGTAEGQLNITELERPQPCANSWPMFACNSGNTGQSSQAFSWPLSLKWTNSTDLKIGTDPHIYTSPAVSNDRIFIANNKGRAVCLNKSDGSQCWRFESGDAFLDNAPAVWNDTYVIFASYVDTAKGKIYARRVSDGSYAWTRDLGANIRGSSPVVAYDTVFVGTENNQVYALNASNGSTKWIFNSPYSNADFHDQPIAVDNGIVYAVAVDRLDRYKILLYAIDAFDKTQYWQYTFNTSLRSGIAGTGVTVYDDTVCSGVLQHDNFTDFRENYIFCVNKFTGGEKWRKKFDVGLAIYDNHAVIHNGKIIIGARKESAGVTLDQLYAYNLSNGAQVWSFDADNYMEHTSPVIINGVLYFMDGEYVSSSQPGIGVLYAVNADTGVELWRYNVGRRAVSNPAVVDNLLVFGTDDARVLAFEPGNPNTCPVVSSNAPSGQNTLADCIAQANATVGVPETITFSISNTTIMPTSQYTVTTTAGALTIDGTGKNIVIDGTNCSSCHGLEIQADGSSVQGLAFTRFTSNVKYGITLKSDNNTVSNCRLGTDFSDNSGKGNYGGILINGESNIVEQSTISGNSGLGVTISGSGAQNNVIRGNKIGTNTAGNASLMNGAGGILIEDGAQNNTVGGNSSLGQGNLISGNSAGYGIRITGTSTMLNAVQGNIIGLAENGSSSLPNYSGIGVFTGANNTLIGGNIADGEGNTISTNDSYGISATQVSGLEVTGNIIGLDKNRTQIRGNGTYGISLSFVSNSSIGTSLANRHNYISGNAESGIIMSDSQSIDIIGNFIGLYDDCPTCDAGNEENGISVSSGCSDIEIKEQGGYRNKIAYNGYSGIYIRSGEQGSIRKNEIFENEGKGISTDIDYHLEILSTISGGGNLWTITGDSTCNSCAVDVFRVDEPPDVNPEDYVTPSAGEGFEYLGSTTTNASNGTWSFGPVSITGGEYVTATVTDGSANTTEFAPNRKLQEYDCPGFVVTSNADSGPKTLRECIALANNTPGEDAISFSISNTTITAQSPYTLDNAGGPVIIDARTKNIVVDGHLCLTCNGFVVEADDSEILGLSVVRYPGNGRHAISVQADGVLIDRCKVGVDHNDNPMGNYGGVYIEGSNNGVYNSTVSSNTNVGVTIAGSASANNEIQNNKIGTNTAGTLARPNQGGGVLIAAGTNNHVGGDTAINHGNLISGNYPGYGVRVTGAGTDDNQVRGNIIGLGSNGARLDNANGVEITAGADGTIVGDAAGPNVLTGNYYHGIYADSATNLSVSYNLIGLDEAGATAPGNSYNGMYIATTAYSDFINNTIGGNGREGIMFNNTSHSTILSNYIGTDSSLTAQFPNNKAGILVTSSCLALTIGNTVGGANVIAYNNLHGIDQRGAGASLLSGNRIFENTGRGIASTYDYDLEITLVRWNGSAYDISGTSTCGLNCRVEVFAVDNLPGVDQDNATTPPRGEAYIYIGQTDTDASGNWTLTGATMPGYAKYVTATISDTGDNTTEYCENKPLNSCPVVSTTEDTGPGSLRQCLAQAQSSPGTTITFHESLTDAVIKPQTELPPFTTDNTTVDGEDKNVTIDGSAPCSNCHGFVLRADNGVVKNMTIVKFNTSSRSGICIDGTIGGGNSSQLLGNKIGTDGNTAGIGNDYGVSIVMGGHDNYIGDGTTAGRNLISGNKEFGIAVTGGGSDDNYILGNYVGTNEDGDAAVPNAWSGIRIGNGAAGNVIGGSSPGQGNVISGNAQNGILINSSASGTIVFGNKIGADAGGADLGNSGNGITIRGSAVNTYVGGPSAGMPNLIIDNGGAGIAVLESTTDFNWFQRNEIYNNGSLGIDLDGTGSNENVIPPTIQTVVAAGTNKYNINGTSSCGAGCRLELFRVDNPPTIGQDGSLAGEAYEFLDVTTTLAGGVWSFSNLEIIGGDYITATITDTGRNTSEFAPNKELPSDGCPGFVVTHNGDTGNSSLRQCILDANASSGETITFAPALNGATIEPATQLPDITGADTTIMGDIDGDHIPDVTISGTNCTNCHGLVVDSDDTDIKYLKVVNFTGTSCPAAFYNNCVGILVTGEHDGNKIQGCYVGTQNGTTAAANYEGIVFAGGSDNMVVGTDGDGSDDEFEGNLISGNNNNGLYFYCPDTCENGVVAGNFVGVNANANGVIGNGNRGIGFGGYHTGFVIGGTTANQRNIVGGNHYGIYFVGAATSHVIKGNYVGIALNSVLVPNTVYGIYVGSGTPAVHAENVTIGGDITTGAGNVISGNQFGIMLAQYASGTNIFGNYIGTKLNGTDPLPNQYGVYIGGGLDPTIGTQAGSSTPNTGNVISGNSENGILIDFTQDTYIQGNIIGLDKNGANPVANKKGILVTENAENVFIGGNTAGHRNIISGNTQDGISVGSASGGNTSGVQIKGNYIGTDINGTTARGNGDSGIHLKLSSNAIIGGSRSAGEANIIGGNETGVFLDAASWNYVFGNYIGVGSDGTTDLGNTYFGVLISGNATNNFIGATDTQRFNNIQYNDGDGIILWSNESDYNAFHRNIIHSNGDMGIRLREADTNDGIIPPSIGTITPLGGDQYDVSGDSDCNGCTIELFRVDDPPTVGQDTATTPSAGEAFEYLTSVTTSLIDGTWSVSNQEISDGEYITATVTDTSNNTSEFATNATLNVDLCPGYEVTSDQDSGLGSLRECINKAENDSVPTPITFHTSMSGDTINLSSTLPTLAEGGTTITNTSGGEVIIRPATALATALTITSANNEIRGLTFTRFTTAGQGAIMISGPTATGNTIAGNYIGTTQAGAAGLGNYRGVTITGTASGNTIGGADPADSNVICSGNYQGVYIVSGSNNTVLGNYIGVAPDGQTPLGNRQGMYIASMASNNTVGGAAAGAGNVISASTDDGIWLKGSSNHVYGNYIGTDKDGNQGAGLGNGQHGVNIDGGAQNDIGGDLAGQANLIAYNTDTGITVETGTQNHISLNRIYENTGMGIDLISNGNTEIDAPAFDTLTALGSDRYDITGTSSCNGCIIELFRVDNPPTVGQDTATTPAAGEAYEFIATTTTSLTDGSWSFGDEEITGGDYITATITDGTGNTSEFAQNEELPDPGCPGFVVTHNGDTGASSLRQCIIEANASSGETITFAPALNGATIEPATQLPDITGVDTTIMGDIDGDHTPDVTISGTNCTDCHGLVVDSDNTDIKYLKVVNFTGTACSGGIVCAGILIDGGHDKNKIQGCYIGTQDGENAAANYIGIIVLSGSNNIVVGTDGDGSDDAFEGNLISGNSAMGVIFDGSITACENGIVAGNLIGVNADADGALGNGGSGIYFAGDTSDFIIGGNNAIKRNIIGGNDSGIDLSKNATGHIIQGNYIGITNNSVPVPNNEGITLDGNATDKPTSILIGGDIPTGERNVISGNVENGIYLRNATGTKIFGNYIGTNIDGTSAVPNNRGIWLANGEVIGTQIGSATANTGNVISGNTNSGIRTSKSSDTYIQSNIIGLDKDGNNSLPNNSGIYAFTNATNLFIGGNTANHRNFISGNTRYGIALSTTSGVQIKGNYIGTDINGAIARGNGDSGIRLYNGANNNIIGGSRGDGEANVIGGSNAHGITIEDSSYNYVYGNYIGVGSNGTTDLGNTGHGVLLTGDAANNFIGATDTQKFNNIQYNGDDGIHVEDADTDYNAFHWNVIHSNTGMGINLVDPDTNEGIDPPSFDTLTALGSDRYDITGTSSCNGCTIELFRVDNPPTVGQDTATTPAAGEAFEYLTSTTTSPTDGKWSISGQLITGGDYITATITDGTGNTSEFAQNEELPALGCPGFVVTHDGDSGTSSLRQCIIEANASSGETITFAPGMIGATIEPATQLPDITGSDTTILGDIDGDHTPDVTISGANCTNCHGLVVDSNDTDIKYLKVVNFTGINCARGVDNNCAGILVPGEHDGNKIQGCYIGTEDGATAAANTDGIVFTGGSDNMVVGTDGDGTDDAFEGNLISGVDEDGLVFDCPDTCENGVAAGNLIGVNANADGVIGNGSIGIHFKDDARYFVVGGTSAEKRNIIGGQSNGISIINNSTGHLIQGNYIGITNNSVPVPNTTVGIYLAGNSSTYPTAITIGGDMTTGERNVISGNKFGIYVNIYASGTKIFGNYIGTDLDGTGNEENLYGILLDAISAPGPIGTQIGSATANTGNVISGNSDVGILLRYSQDTYIQGNIIGLDKNGSNPLANKKGIVAGMNARDLAIGGNTANHRNIISGNTLDGIYLSRVSGANIKGNYIGTDINGTTARGNGDSGILLSFSAENNTIGGSRGDGEANVIGGSNAHGITIEDSSYNYVYGNYIGVGSNGTTDLGNTGHGVLLTGDAANNFIGATDTQKFNNIQYNGDDGIHVEDADTDYNAFHWNVIHSNTGMGINLVDPDTNEGIDPPSFDTLTALGSDRYDITGTSACLDCTIELFRVDNPPTVGQDTATTPAAGEAFEYLSSTTTSPTDGKWSISGQLITGGDYITATITDGTGNTSEFAQNEELPEPNTPPVITLTTPASGDISFFEAITLNVQANDPDGDPLTYEWSGGGMSPFTATTSVTTDWSGPLDAYTAQITITVRDGRGGEASATIPVRVGIKDLAQLNAIPDTLSIAAGNTHDFKLMGVFTTGHSLWVNPEAASTRNGRGTVDLNGHFTALTAGDEVIDFSLGIYTKSVPVVIY